MYQRLQELSEKVFSSNPFEGRIGSIDFNVWLAQISGIPLMGLRQESTTFRIWSPIYSIPVLFFVTFCYIGFELYDLLLNFNRLDLMTQNICLTLTHIAGLYKISNTLYSLSIIKVILTQLRDIAKRYVITEKQINTFHHGEFETKTPLMIYATLVGFTGFFGYILLAFNHNTIAGKVFPYRVKFPNCFPIQLQWIYMGLSVIIYALQIVSIDYLNITMMNQICIQLKIMNLAFEKLTQVSEKDILIKRHEPCKHLNFIVEHHCELRVIREKIDALFSTPVLIQFVTSLTIFAMTGFVAIVQPSGTNIMIYLYCGCILCQLFLYCWFGNEVFEQSKTLASSGFASTWYNYDYEFKKSLHIFITNAQKPFFFTAGGFIILSLPSFAGILSNSYSFIAVLRQIYAQK